jgi:hypothetical protein
MSRPLTVRRLVRLTRASGPRVLLPLKKLGKREEE